jgi:hypothetical protein
VVAGAPLSELEAALNAAAVALDAGDTAGAAEGSLRAARACAELEASGGAPDRDALQRALALHRRCSAAAEQTMERLVGELQVAARSRRASDAYGR